MDSSKFSTFSMLLLFRISSEFELNVTLSNGQKEMTVSAHVLARLEYSKTSNDVFSALSLAGALVQP